MEFQLSSAIQQVAKKTAANNGITIDQAIAVNAGNLQSILNENPHPSNSPIAGSIKLVTYFGGNINNNSIAVEQYSIRPTFTGLFTCSGPQKGIWYFPIPNSIYALKFYGPDEYNSQYYNIVYCVPAKVDSSYLTGYMDYITAVPPEFVTAFIQYASTLPNNVEDSSLSAVPSGGKKKSFVLSEATQNVHFTFNFCGNISGTLGKSSSFAFEFVFYPGQAPLQPAVIGSNTLQS